MVKIKRKTNTLLWVAIGTILLVGITFASIFYYQKSIAVPVYKTAVTVNATMQEDLSKVVKGETVIRKASFTTHTDSGDIYVRANIRYYVNSTMSSDTRKFLLAVNYKDITTATGTDYKWVRGEDEYYYLTDTSGNPLKVSGGSATEYTICEGVTYTGPVSILDSVEAPSDLRLKLEVQTINTKNITTTTLDSIALNFKEDFGNNYTLGYIVTFDTDNAGSCPAQVFLTNDGTVTRPEEPSKVGYIFKGWYLDSNYNTEYTFTNKVTSNLTLYAKFVEGKTVTITKDINITSVTVTTNGETVSSGDLVPVNAVLTIAVTPASGYTASWTVTNDNTIIVGSPTSVTVTGNVTITAVGKLPYTFGQYDSSGNTDGRFANYYYVDMGYYPQTLYTGSATMTQVTGETYNIDGSPCNVYTDGTDKYVEFNANSENNVCLSSSNSKYSNYQKYEGTKYYKIEPVRWLILGSVNEDQTTTAVTSTDFETVNETLTYKGSVKNLLVLSEKVLTQQIFNPYTTHTTSAGTTAYNDWEKSAIREFMNGTFLKDLFKNGEDEYINPQDLTTFYIDTSSNKRTLDTTGDKLFPLSYTQSSGTYGATDDFILQRTLKIGTTTSNMDYSTSSKTILKAKATDLGFATGCYYDTSYPGYSFWWLRAGYYDYSNFACYVTTSGDVYDNNGDYTLSGVRAAFVMDIA